MNPLLEQFLQEARENLAFIDQNIENIGSDDPELLNSVFRAAHTLKGGSGIVGFESVKVITHHAEDLLDMLRSGQLSFKEEMLEALFNAFDEVMNLIEAAEDSEDIVDADEDTVSKIVDELSAQMGKDTEEVAAWECPFVMAADTQSIVNLPMPFLSTADLTLAYEIGDFNEEALSHAQLYAVQFDIDESCMVYGNDPAYTMSLLGEQVKGIHACMSEENAKAALSGMDDPDGLLLRIQMTAFIHATYEEIEDALFNFADELQILPLDVNALLKINKGESGHKLDILKELSGTVAPLLASGDKAALTAEIEKSLQMIGTDTIQYFQLERIMQLANLIETAALPKLSGFFAQLYRGVPYSEDAEVTESAQSVATPAAEPEVAAAPAVTSSAVSIDVSDEETDAGIQEILEQQLHTLRVVSDADALERVTSILEQVRPYVASMPASFESATAIEAWINSELGLGESVEAQSAEPETVVTQSVPEPAVAEEVNVPVEEAYVEPVKVEVAKESPAKDVDKVIKEAPKKNVIGKTVKIEQESIDNLMNIVGELLVAKNSLPYLADGVNDMNSEMIRRAIMEKYTFINRLSEQLQDLIMSMRMLPISYVFDRYPKLVRDISRNLGKKVKLEMQGGETKLDKNMIEMLADPMIHIMRNSLDHGIEAPEVREANGKSSEGNIDLRAFAQSDKILIEIKDDGAGINVEKVMHKVLEKGLMTHEQLDALSDDERAELVMLPGLSTADEISEYSGRGVGMDVVRKSIEGFGGTISIRTVANKGTTITLTIPVSLAVTSLLHVTMDNVHYGFPMDSVSETVKIEKEEIEYLHNEPFVYIRGEVIPLLFVKSMLNEDELADKPLSIVVLNVKGNLLAVVVNELLGQLDVVQKPLEGIMESHPIFSGTALLGNGQIIMAIDPIGLLSIAHELKSDDDKAS